MRGIGVGEGGQGRGCEIQGVGGRQEGGAERQAGRVSEGGGVMGRDVQFLSCFPMAGYQWTYFDENVIHLKSWQCQPFCVYMLPQVRRLRHGRADVLCVPKRAVHQRARAVLAGFHERQAACATRCADTYYLSRYRSLYVAIPTGARIKRG